MRRTSTVLGLAGIASAALIQLAPSALAYPPTGGSLTLSSYAVPLGGQDSAVGHGFAAGEGINGFLHSARVFVGHTVASSNGVARLTFTVPTSLALGTHTFEVVGSRSGITESATLTVLPARGVHASSGSTVPSTGSGLPFTGGNDIWAMTGVGAGLVAAGAAALVVVRRRRSQAGIAA